MAMTMTIAIIIMMMNGISDLHPFASCDQEELEEYSGIIQPEKMS